MRILRLSLLASDLKPIAPPYRLPPTAFLLRLPLTPVYVYLPLSLPGTPEFTL